MANQLNEQTPSEQAKALGLTYGGFGGWVDNSRRVVAKTVDGKLVKVSDNDSESQKDMGALTVLSFPDDLMFAEKHQIPDRVVAKFNSLIKGILKFEGTFVVFTPRNGEKDVARYLKEAGITANVKLVPYGSADPNKKRTFIQKKIKGGFREIRFFDTDSKAVAAIESLKAPFNKLDMKLQTFALPALSKGNTGMPSHAPVTDAQGQDKEAA